MSTDHDPLVDELAELTEDAPASLLDRVVARWSRVTGPVGTVYVAATDHGVSYLRSGDAVGDDPEAFASMFRRRFSRPLLPAEEPPDGVAHALRTGRADHLSFDLRGLGEFDRAVLSAARTIPPGRVRPYGWVARAIGRPKAARAVGSALGRNPVPLLIPCHRVVRSDAGVGEYVFGSHVKESLLRVENVDLAEARRLARAGWPTPD